MNYCMKCQSLYNTPGTCNCYAALPFPRYPQPSLPVPGTGDPWPPIRWTGGCPACAQSGVCGCYRPERGSPTC